LGNIIDTTTNQVPEHLKTFEEFERAGVRVGVMGLLEKCGPLPSELINYMLTLKLQRMDCDCAFLACEFPVRCRA